MNIHLVLATLLLFQAAAPAALPDNQFVRVTRDAAPCAGGEAGCGDRILIALSTITVNGQSNNATLTGSGDATLTGSGGATLTGSGGATLTGSGGATLTGSTTLQRGDVKVFPKGERYAPPASGEYLEVSVKPDHPRSVLPPKQNPRSPNLHVLYENNDFIVFHESMQPGELGPQHSHFQRLTVTLASTKVEQWTDGKETVRDLVADTVGFGPAVTHTSKALGPGVLSNLSIEFKP